MRTAKTLIRLGGCPGWSESSLGAQAILLVLLWGGSYYEATTHALNINVYITGCCSPSHATIIQSGKWNRWNTIYCVLIPTFTDVNPPEKRNCIIQTRQPRSFGFDSCCVRSPSVPIGGAANHMQISVGTGTRITYHHYINENLKMHY